jgi:hypothetical protein
MPAVGERSEAHGSAYLVHKPSRFVKELLIESINRPVLGPAC